MNGTISHALIRLRDAVTGADGLEASLNTLREYYPVPLNEWSGTAVEIMRTPADLEERARTVKHPRIGLFVERIENGREERFNRFAGTLRAAFEIRVSQDRLEGLAESLYWYVDALRDVIEKKAGCLDEGLVLTGEYEVHVEPVKKGGLNFQQTAKVMCPVVMSRR
jgi:hypothetical protein